LTAYRKHGEEPPPQYEGGIPILPGPAEREDAARTREKIEEREYKHEQTSIQRCILRTQITLVFFGLLGAGVGIWQARIAQQSADSSQKSVLLAQKTERETRLMSEKQLAENQAQFKTTSDSNQKQFTDTLAQVKRQTSAQIKTARAATSQAQIAAAAAGFIGVTGVNFSMNIYHMKTGRGERVQVPVVDVIFDKANGHTPAFNLKADVKAEFRDTPPPEPIKSALRPIQNYILPPGPPNPETISTRFVRTRSFKSQRTAKYIYVIGRYTYTTALSETISDEFCLYVLAESVLLRPALQASVAVESEIVYMFEQTAKAFGKVDVLVNNAGVYAFAPIESVTAEEFAREFNTNVLGLLLVTKTALSHFPETGGNIVNISSVVSTMAPPTASVYAGSKGAVDTITKTLAKELGARKIRVNAVNPGLVITEGLHTAGMVGNAFEDQMVAMTPLGRAGHPDDIALPVVFLASDDARWINGVTILASGGADI
jgi:3-oxoacyl-[acyl-carrier protein] reductase